MKRPAAWLLPGLAAIGMLTLMDALVGQYPGVFWAFIFVTAFWAIAAELTTRSFRRRIDENSDKIGFLMLHLGLEEKYKRSQDPQALLDDLIEGSNARIRQLKAEVEALRSDGGGKPESIERPKT